MLIHQIWIDGEIPEDMLPLMVTWQGLKGHTYKLWRDADLEIYKEDLIKARISNLHATFKSDLLRDLILRDNGGLYVDTDCALVGDLPQFRKFACVMNPSPEYNNPDNYMLYSPKGSVQINAMIEYGMTVAPQWINAFNRFGSGAIIALFGNAYARDITSWCRHQHRFSWMQKRRQESVSIPMSKKLLSEL
jgi:mannosyltransferase OCH1-like enzyme